MSGLREAFSKGKAFIGFVTGGDPSISDSLRFILEAERAGADVMEIGVPFSDPIAEGPVIQAANERALKAGATLDGIFKLVIEVRKRSAIPIVLLTYANPVYRRGYANFFRDCQRAGVSGVIIPDIPYEERRELNAFSEQSGVDLITLIAPTSVERIGMLVKNAKGFIYVVSSLGVTGVRDDIKADFIGLVSSVKAVSNIPVAVGFGINTPAQAAEISAFSDGIIVGSAIVRIVEEYGEGAGPYIYDYVRKMKEAIKS